MTERRSIEYRMPVTGEEWRHYKGVLYTIIGVATDPNGKPQVVYTPTLWLSSQPAPIFTRPLEEFLQSLNNRRPRFTYKREPDYDPNHSTRTDAWEHNNDEV